MIMNNSQALLFQKLKEITDTISLEGEVKDLFVDYFRSIRIDQKRSVYLAEMMIKDWNVSDISAEEKIWSVEKGFRPTRLIQYDLTEQNYKDYLSDVDYYRMHPLNNHFAFWINDKITLKYVLPEKIRLKSGETMRLMPYYYLYVENDGHYTYLMDSPEYIQKDKDYLVNLLKDKKVLAMKPSNGAGGKGFIKAEYRVDQFYINEKMVDENELRSEFSDINGYLVSEYFYQHSQLRGVWPQSENTLRIVAVRNYDDMYSGGKIDIISSYVRFGSVVSKGVCNMAAGGLNLSFNFETGKYGDFMNRHRMFCPDGNIRFLEHPDTHVSLSGQFLPNIEKVKASVYALCNHLSSLEYFGIDIIVGEHDVMICEVNTLPGLDSIQILDGPIWKSPNAAKFFARKMRKLQ